MLATAGRTCAGVPVLAAPVAQAFGGGSRQVGDPGENIDRGG